MQNDERVLTSYIHNHGPFQIAALVYVRSPDGSVDENVVYACYAQPSWRDISRAHRRSRW